MNYRKLGQSDLSISEIGFGCMSLGSDIAQNRRLLDNAINAGINFFDTADLYQQGANEQMLGQLTRHKRNHLILATKVGNQLNADGNGWRWNPRKEYILAQVENSLKRLQTDYIDLYQLHGGTIDDPIDDVIDAFDRLKQQGKIRAYGISSIRPNVIREYGKRSSISSVMMQYSLLDRRPEESCLPLLQQHQIGVLARGALAKGLLIDKAPDKFAEFDEEEVRVLVTNAKEIARHYPPASMAVGFVLANPAITSAVIGIRTAKQLEDVLVASEKQLSKATIDQLRELPRKDYKEHR